MLEEWGLVWFGNISECYTVLMKTTVKGKIMRWIFLVVTMLITALAFAQGKSVV